MHRRCLWKKPTPSTFKFHLSKPIFHHPQRWRKSPPKWGEVGYLSPRYTPWSWTFTEKGGVDHATWGQHQVFESSLLDRAIWYDSNLVETDSHWVDFRMEDSTEQKHREHTQALLVGAHEAYTVRSFACALVLNQTTWCSQDGHKPVLVKSKTTQEPASHIGPESSVWLEPACSWETREHIGLKDICMMWLKINKIKPIDFLGIKMFIKPHHPPTTPQPTTLVLICCNGFRRLAMEVL